MPDIAAVYPNTVRYLQAPVDFKHVGSEEYLPSVGRRQAANGSDETQLYFGQDGTPLINPHAMTGVDRLHAEGVTGEGIKIAVIDAGIDAFHEALGGGFGPGFKVAGGYDFVGDQPDNNVDPPSPDNSPQTVCANHGTATSAIAAGLPYKFGFVGVAPNATIYHYKVFPCSGGVSTDVGVNASLAAYEEGVDVINASIGGQGGWGIDLWGVIASRIMANGTAYIISAGNDGARGTFIANSLSSTQGVPSIGSIDNAYSPTLVANGSYSVNEGEAVPIEVRSSSILHSHSRCKIRATYSEAFVCFVILFLKTKCIWTDSQHYSIRLDFLPTGLRLWRSSICRSTAARRTRTCA